MNDVRWSDSELRKYILSETHYEYEYDTALTNAARDRFRAEAAVRVVPGVQARLLEEIGTVTDPNGIALVARELLIGICCDTAKRRWLLVSPEPWSYIEGWVAREITKAYKATAGADHPSRKSLKEIERANQ
jgi:hypothetical protein